MKSEEEIITCLFTVARHPSPEGAMKSMQFLLREYVDSIPPLSLRSRMNDLATEMRKHSNDHLHDEDPIKAAQAAVEGVCADRIEHAINLAGEER